MFGDPKLPRLEAIAGERDGFRLAEIDLELRGAGDVLGTRQHGLPEFRVARLPEDAELLVRARDRADAILLDDPRLEPPEHALLRDAVVGALRLRARPDPGMSEVMRILERGYEMMWREDRLEDALIGLDPEFEWVVPGHPEGDVRRGAEATIAFFRDWIEPWEELQVDWELLPADPDRVLAILEHERPRPRERRARRHAGGPALDLQRGPRRAHGHVLRRRRGAARGGRPPGDRGLWLR